MIDNLDRKILLALSYTDQFSYPLTKTEVYLRLIGKGSYSKQQFSKSLNKLVKNNLIDKKANFYFLKNRQNIVYTRYKRYYESKKKWIKVEEFVSLIQKIPFVVGVAVTGSLSVDNATKKDDIDFLVVSENNRTWIVRVVVVILSWLKHKKRVWGKVEEKDLWCLNLWLEEDSLLIPKNLKSIYTAFEVFQARWIYEKSNIKRRFLENNSWSKVVLPNFYEFNVKNTNIFKEKKKNVCFFSALISNILNCFNSFLYFIQYLYMKRRMTLEVVDKQRAFFHPRSTKKVIYQRWFKRVKILLRTRILVTGVFDVLHEEHTRFLKKAKKLGNELLIGVESDKRVREMKGKTRPINKEENRVTQLKKLGLADSIFILPEKFDKPLDHLLFLIKYKPKYLAVSSHTAYLEQKRKLMSFIGGEVKVVHRQNKKISTTKIIKSWQK